MQGEEETVGVDERVPAGKELVVVGPVSPGWIVRTTGSVRVRYQGEGARVGQAGQDTVGDRGGRERSVPVSGGCEDTADVDAAAGDREVELEVRSNAPLAQDNEHRSQ